MFNVNFKDRIFDFQNQVNATRVQIQEGQTIITKVLKGDVASKDDEELIHLVLEQFYNDVFPNRAENERFAKMDKVIRESNESLELTRKALASNGLLAYENQSELEYLHSLIEFIAKHLKLELPNDDEEGEEHEETNESTEGKRESTDA